MPYLLKDIHDGVFIQFTASEMASNAAVTVFTMLSLCFGTLAIYALLKQRDVPLDTRFILSMLFADFFFGVLCVTVEVINGTFTLELRRLAFVTNQFGLSI